MPDDTLQTAMQPYLRLVYNNLGLLTKFSSSPEVVARAAASAQSLLRQGQESAAGLVHSNAFAELVQGMLKNHTEFLAELGQVGMALLTQGQAAMAAPAQEASEQVADASKTGKRGLRRVA
jgi:hypothetical protein